jgi:hypothetical protein
MCGRARTYQLVTSRRPITARSFARAKRLSVHLRPGAAGARQRLGLGSSALRYVAIRTVDGAGNVGLPLVVKIAR